METSNDWITDCSSNCFNHIAHYRTRYKSGATWRNRADQGSRYPIREEEPTNKPKAAVKVTTAPPAQNPYIPPKLRIHRNLSYLHVTNMPLIKWTARLRKWSRMQGLELLLAGQAEHSMYRFNENQTNDARYQEAYSSYMRSSGYYS